MSTRVAKWDNLKCVLIFCVVAGHFLARIDDQINARRLIFFIYLFHMPAFMFLSGLMSKKTIRERRYDRILSFLIAFILVKIVLLAIRWITHHDLHVSILGMNDISWYLFVLFLFHLITIWTERFRPVAVLAVSVAAACAAGYVEAFGTWLSLARLFSFYPFFLAGYFTDADKLLAFTGQKKVRAAGFAVLLAAAALVYAKIDQIWWLLRILKGKSPYAELASYNAYGWLLRLGWYAVSAIMILALSAAAPAIRSRITIIGSRTLQIYMLHYIPLVVFFQGLNGKKLVLQSGHAVFWLLFASLADVLILSGRYLEKGIRFCTTFKSIDRER